MAKVAVFDGVSLLEVAYDSNRNLEHLSDIYSKYHFEKAIVATVIDLSEQVLAQLALLPIPVLWLNEMTPLPVVNLYETPRTLGYDRMAAVVGANEQFPGKDILVIDAGTCITYEFVDAEGRYHGGNISPGLEMRFRGLQHFTARLPLVSPEKEYGGMGTTTVEAIRNGVKQRMLFEVESYIRHFLEGQNQGKVVITGGNAYYLEQHLQGGTVFNENLGFVGLNEIFLYTKKLN